MQGKNFSHPRDTQLNLSKSLLGARSSMTWPLWIVRRGESAYLAWWKFWGTYPSPKPQNLVCLGFCPDLSRAESTSVERVGPPGAPRVRLVDFFWRTDVSQVHEKVGEGNDTNPKATYLPHWHHFSLPWLLHCDPVGDNSAGCKLWRVGWQVVQRPEIIAFPRRMSSGSTCSSLESWCL